MNSIWEVEEQKAKKRAYQSTPEAKAKRKAYHAKPEVKAKRKAWSASPEVKEKQKENRSTPECKARIKAYSLAYRSKPENKEWIKARQKAWRDKPETKVTRQASQKERSERIKRTVLNGYGGCKCIWCGDTVLANLTLDHIANDGAKHRKKLRTDGSGDYNRGDFYTLMIKQGFPEGLQVCCMGCNWAKRMNGGILPTERHNLYTDALKGRDLSRLNNRAFAEARLAQLEEAAWTSSRTI